jgi:hypothetical protein
VTVKSTPSGRRGMNPASLRTHSRTCVACHACGNDDEMTVDHLFPMAVAAGTSIRWGPWYCKQCGASTQGETRPDGSVWAEPGRSRKEDRAVLLKREVPGSDPVYLVVKGMRFVDEGQPRTDEDYRSGARYYYEEGTCPSNYFRDTAAIICGRDDDPHGLFSYVTDAPLKGNEETLGMGVYNVTGRAAEILAVFGVTR